MARSEPPLFFTVAESKHKILKPRDQINAHEATPIPKTSLSLSTPSEDSFNQSLSFSVSLSISFYLSFYILFYILFVLSQLINDLHCSTRTSVGEGDLTRVVKTAYNQLNRGQFLTTLGNRLLPVEPRWKPDTPGGSVFPHRAARSPWRLLGQ